MYLCEVHLPTCTEPPPRSMAATVASGPLPRRPSR